VVSLFTWLISSFFNWSCGICSTYSTFFFYNVESSLFNYACSILLFILLLGICSLNCTTTNVWCTKILKTDSLIFYEYIEKLQWPTLSRFRAFTSTLTKDAPTQTRSASTPISQCAHTLVVCSVEKHLRI